MIGPECGWRCRRSSAAAAPVAAWRHEARWPPPAAPPPPPYREGRRDKHADLAELDSSAARRSERCAGMIQWTSWFEVSIFGRLCSSGIRDGHSCRPEEAGPQAARIRPTRTNPARQSRPTGPGRAPVVETFGATVDRVAVRYIVSAVQRSCRGPHCQRGAGIPATRIADRLTMRVDGAPRARAGISRAQRRVLTGEAGRGSGAAGPPAPGRGRQVSHR